jgi:hypothetical protein
MPEMILCACGCGKTLSSIDAKGRPRQMIHGHNTRGTHWRWEHTRSLEERFWEKVTKTDGCWLWNNGQVQRTGYGTLYIEKGKHKGAHVVSFYIAHGRWPESETLDHLCRNRACVNPDHLEEVSRGENVRRGFVSRRTDFHRCGRPFDGLCILKNGKSVRYCKICARENARRYNARIRSQKGDH